MGRWVTSKGRRIYIPDEGEENPFSKEKKDKRTKEVKEYMEETGKGLPEATEHYRYMHPDEEAARDKANKQLKKDIAKDQLARETYDGRSYNELNDAQKKSIDEEVSGNKSWAATMESYYQKEADATYRKRNEKLAAAEERKGKNLPIDKDEETKQKQIAENKRQADKLNGKSDYIISKNSDGQEIHIPRKTYEDRLQKAKDYKQSLYDMANRPHSRYKLNPDDLRKADAQIKELENTLKAGTTKYDKKDALQKRKERKKR